MMSTRWRRFRGLFGLDPRRDVEDELSFHLEMRIRELVDRGESSERARELALRRFGNLEHSRKECVAIDERRRRRMMRADFITDRGQDIRFALRMFRRAPGFTTVAVLTLAFGIGANVAVFSLFYRLILQPLPVPEPRQLVNLVSPGPRSGPTSCGIMGECEAVFSYPMFRDLERVQTGFTDIAAAQVALSMVLIVLAGLFTKSLANISRVDPGLRTDGVVTFAISPLRNGYTLPRSVALFDRLEEEIAALPGVTAVILGSRLRSFGISKLEVVSLNFASWNRLDGWLRQVDRLWRAG